MIINFANLIYTVQECFDYISNCEKMTRSNEWRMMSAEQRRYYERNEFHANNEIWGICNILEFDSDRLYTIARMVRRWEEAQHWEKCFPFNDEINRRIYEYLKK